MLPTYLSQSVFKQATVLKMVVLLNLFIQADIIVLKSILEQLVENLDITEISVLF